MLKLPVVLGGLLPCRRRLAASLHTLCLFSQKALAETMPARAGHLLPSIWDAPEQLQQNRGAPAGALAHLQACADGPATTLLLHSASPSPPGLPSERPTHRRRCAFVAAVLILVLAIVAALVVAALEHGGSSSGGGGAAGAGAARSNAQISGGGSYPVSFFAVSALPSTIPQAWICRIDRVTAKCVS